MRKLYLLSILMCICFYSCFYPYEVDEPGADNSGYYYSSYEPVYYARAELDSMIKLKPAQEIVNSGKIYIINDLLFVGESQLGFHIFDNSDVRNPVNIKFLEVLGSTDIAIRNDILYINQATDLITLRYNFAKDSLSVIKRIENAFSTRLSSPDGYYAYYPSEDSLLVNWKLKK